MTDKIIVTNQSALKSKYGDKVSDVQDALQSLVQADSGRGLTTTIVAIDDQNAMNAYTDAVAVTGPGDELGTKNAINAILKGSNPDYLMILGGPDVVCHQALTNPMASDGDATVPSDLPYASTSDYSQQISSHIGATNVVGRLPDLPGAKAPDFLVDLIDKAAKAGTREAGDYQANFGISAQVWQSSTQSSLNAIFGGTPTLNLAPPSGPPQPADLLAPRSHFINCHGAQSDYRFYGQQGNNYPVALESSDIRGKITEGTVVSAECCYGGELYDPALSTDMGLCCTYLSEGAYGFFGSSTIAYGPASGNANADLITQYFLKKVISTGASLGEACLQARQQFVQTAGPVLGNSDMKTIGQFFLLGDPSVHPVARAETDAGDAAKAVFGAGEAAKVARTARRQALSAKGAALPWTVVYPKTRNGGGGPDTATAGRLKDFASRLGMAEPEIASYDVEGDPDMLQSAKSFGQLPKIHVLMRKYPAPGKIKTLRALIIHQYDGRLVPHLDVWSR